MPLNGAVGELGYARRHARRELAARALDLSAMGGDDRADAFTRAAYFAGELIGRNLVDRSDAGDQLTGASIANGLFAELGADEIQEELAASLAAGCEAAREALKAEQELEPEDTKQKAHPKITFGTLADLRKKEFAPLKYVVPGILTEGCTVLAGRPKIGKSWMGLDIALAVASGGQCLGGRRCEQGDALYLALEDGERRLQRRIDKLLSPFGGQWPARFQYATSSTGVGCGDALIEQLEAWCASVAKPRLIQIDVLARVRPPVSNKVPAYDADYKALASLTDLAARRSLATVVIHHTRKGVSDDPVDQISGTLGLAGAADAFLVLQRSGQGTTLTGRGRDIEDLDLAVAFDRGSCRWSILGAASEVHRSSESASVITALRKAGQAMSVKDILTATDYDDREALDKLLSRMVERGELSRSKRGVYDLTPLSEGSEVRNF
jgi:AAA domain